MTDRQLQFRVGLFVIAATILVGALVLRFGEMQWLLQPTYSLAIHFNEAPGVQVMTPVRKNGIAIGAVREIFFDKKRGGVTVVAAVQQRYRLRSDTQARLARSLLGDASIEFAPGKSRKYLRAGQSIEGLSPIDPLEIVQRFEITLNETMTSFRETSDQWRKVAERANDLLDTNHGNLQLVVERAAESLQQFTLTMKNANDILGSPQNQRNLQKTLSAMPKMMQETQRTIAAVRAAAVIANENLTNLTKVTQPLAKHSHSIVTKLDNSVANLDALLVEMQQFAGMLNKEEGSLKQFISDPELYQNLNRSAASLDVLLRNLEPMTRDLRIFADKIARHPERIGIGGALKGSSGLK